MKKTVLTIALALVLVMAFASVAVARGYIPNNRSSSYLSPGESYVSWDKAQSDMAVVGESAAATASVHGNYSTTTIKCQVCHSAHKASATGDTLLQSTAAQACVPCHLGANASTDLKVSEGNRHGSASGCTSGYCHAVAPHGAGDISQYATLKTAMLTGNVDSMLGAAIQSGVSNVPEDGWIYDTAGSQIATMSVYNPNVTAALLNDTSDAASIAFGRAVGTGYVCMNGACHMNGAFNSLSDDATVGEWGGPVEVEAGTYQPRPPSYPTTIPVGFYEKGDTFTDALGTWDVWELLHMREEPIKGHTLAAVADLTVRDVAYANVGTCNKCHDSIDYRISTTAKQFPHGNDVILSDGTDSGDNSAAWFMLKSSVDGSTLTTTTNDRTPDAPGDYTSGMDGACLKCHRATDSGDGVGFDY